MSIASSIRAPRRMLPHPDDDDLPPGCRIRIADNPTAEVAAWRGELPDNCYFEGQPSKHAGYRNAEFKCGPNRSSNDAKLIVRQWLWRAHGEGWTMGPPPNKYKARPSRHE
jgi:hypothetical protein